jgi:3-hydroxybutyryl-CoA dehydrogenase
MSAPIRGPLDGITRIGVVGAGQMGRGIAQLAASHGFAVTLADAQREIAERGRAAVGQQLAKLVDKQKLTGADATRLTSSRPTLYASWKRRLRGQAATENFTRSARSSRRSIRPPGGVVLRPTMSSISITAIGAAVTRPSGSSACTS